MLPKRDCSILSTMQQSLFSQSFKNINTYSVVNAFLSAAQITSAYATPIRAVMS